MCFAIGSQHLGKARLKSRTKKFTSHLIRRGGGVCPNVRASLYCRGRGVGVGGTGMPDPAKEPLRYWRPCMSSLSHHTTTPPSPPPPRRPCPHTPHHHHPHIRKNTYTERERKREHARERESARERERGSDAMRPHACTHARAHTAPATPLLLLLLCHLNYATTTTSTTLLILLHPLSPPPYCPYHTHYRHH